MTLRHLSPSQVAMFKKCPKQWYFAYVLGKRMPPSGAQHLGSSAHKSFEAHNKFKVRTRENLPADELADRYSQAFKSISPSSIQWEGEDPDRVYDDGQKIVGLFSETSAKSVQPVVVEQKVVVSISEPDAEPVPPLFTVLDVVDEEQRVIDYKTKGKTPPADEAHNSDQLSAYALAHLTQFGAPPKELRLDIFVRPMKTKPNGSYQEQVTTRGEDQAEIYKSDVRAVASQIGHAAKTGLFPYAPADSWACSEKFCGYFAICPGGAARRVSFASSGTPAAEEPVGETA